MVRCISALFATATILTAVGSGAIAQEECLPKEIAMSAAPAPPPAEAPARHGHAAVYLDQSTSMQGFVHPSLGQQPIYADVVLGLRQALEQVSENAAFNRFGKEIMLLPTSELMLPTQPISYVCDRTGRNKERSNSCDTRIDKVLEVVAKSTDDTLSLMVTDLFLSTKEMTSSAYGTMRNSLENLLLAGKSIGIVGVSAPFDGKIFDIPGKASSFFWMHRGDRPFFLLIMGHDDDQILKLMKIIKAQLLANTPEERYRFAFFTLHPARPVTSATPLQIDDTDVRPGGRLRGVPPRLPLVVLGKGSAPTARQPLGPPEEPVKVPIGGFMVGETLWVYRDSVQCRSRWLPWRQPGVIKADAEPDERGRVVLRFDRTGLRNLPRQTFLLRTVVTATGDGQSQRPPGWLREWGFRDAETAEVLKKKPKFFPALNLGQLGDVLAGIINSDFRPIVIGDYLIVFRKSD